MKKNQSVFPQGTCRFAVVAALCAVSLGAFAGRTIYIHPSAVNHMTNTWNACSFFNSHNPKVYSNLKDSERNATGVSFFLMAPAARWANVASATFTGDAAEFEPGRSTGDAITAVAVDPFSSSENAVWREPNLRGRLLGLDPGKLYEISFVAQYAGSSNDLSARYTVIGATSGSAVLNAAKNTTRVARIPFIAPTAAGMIEFTIAATESNTSLERVACISGLKIEEMDDIAAQDIYIDLISNTSTASDSKTWNTVGGGNSKQQLLDRDGNATQVSVAHSSAGCPSTGVNSSATTPLIGDAAEFEAARGTQQFFWQNGTATLKVTGLNPVCTYSFTFVASRVNDNTSTRYDTDYTVAGVNSGTVTFNPRSNSDQVARVSGIRPDNDGSATVTIKRNSANNSTYFYLLAYKISREPLTVSGSHVVAVDATTGGSVSATVGGTPSGLSRLLTSGQSMVATATPAAGYRFVGWTSSWTNTTETANPITLPGDTSATWTAVFEKDSAYVSKTAYFDVCDTPGTDPESKVWNNISAKSSVLYAWNRELGPYLASDGTPAAFSLRTVHPFGLSASNGGGPRNPDATTAFSGDALEFEPARAGGSSLYFQINYGDTSVTNRAYIAFDVRGLKPGRPYTFRFMTTRMGATDNREVLFRCSGENTARATVNACDNTTLVATCANVIPDADGVIHMDISPGPANNQSNRFGYLTAFSIAGDISETDARRILWFGNSFTRHENLPDRVAALAELAGYTRPVIVANAVDGAKLSDHISSVVSSPSSTVTAPEIVYQTSNNWNDVVIQGYSTEATSAYTTAPSAGFIPNATNLYARVRKSTKGGGVRAVLFETWARGVGHEFYPDTFASPQAMQGEITANYRAASGLLRSAWGGKEETSVIAPVGQAFGKDDFAAELYGGDLYHADGRGVELAAMVLFNTIYGDFIEEKTTYAEVLAAGATELSESEWNRLARYAHAVFIHGCTVIFR